MTSKTFLIIALIFLSKISLGQANPEQDTTSPAIRNNPPISATQNNNTDTNSNSSRPPKNNTTGITVSKPSIADPKKSLAKPATTNSKSATKSTGKPKPTPPKKTPSDNSTKRGNKNAKNTGSPAIKNEASEKPTSGDTTQDVSKNDVAIAPANKQVHDTKPSKDTPSNKKTKPPPLAVVPPVPTKIPDWLMIGAVLMTLATGFLLFITIKMAGVNKLRLKKISNYISYIDNLKNFLLKRKLLDARGNYEPKYIYSKTEELIDKYIDEINRPKVNPEPEKNIPLVIQSEGNASTSTTFVPYVATLPLSFIKSEIILSAGPRKDTSNDTELGEDVAGLVSLPNYTYFWLLDGTSDSANFSGDNPFEKDHLFSSRVLAQSIGYFIQKNITQYSSKTIPLNELLVDAGNYVAQEWEERLNNDQSGRKESIIEDLRKGHQLICSTTIIIGCLFDNGRLYALRAGDSKIFPFKKSANGLSLDKKFKFALDPGEENDRIAFGLELNEIGNTLKIHQNKELKWLSQSAEDIQCVFAFSDGIGPITQTQLASDKPGIVEMIRENIARIPQKKQDDKTLIILERITNSE